MPTKSKSSITTKKGEGLITREDLLAGKIKLDDIVTGKKIPPIHPGQILLHDVIEPLGITPYRLAKDLSVPLTRITNIIAGNRSITAETAFRLSRYLGTSAEFWLGLQSQYELDVVRDKLGKIVTKEVTPRAA
ncbi:MAG: HigA family addiction module antitoxin [Alphaproteobacteria bacterium]